MRFFNRRITDAAASRIANYGIDQMGFYNPDQEVDITFVREYLTQVVKDYDELIMREKKRSMVKGALITAGVIFAVQKLTDDKEGEEK